MIGMPDQCVACTTQVNNQWYQYQYSRVKQNLQQRLMIAITVAIVDQTAQPYAKDKSNIAALKCKDKRQEASLSCDI